jgi:hypothetical protein
MDYKSRNPTALMLMFLVYSLMLHWVTEIRISNLEDIIFHTTEPHLRAMSI